MNDFFSDAWGFWLLVFLKVDSDNILLNNLKLAEIKNVVEFQEESIFRQDRCKGILKSCVHNRECCGNLCILERT